MLKFEVEGTPYELDLDFFPVRDAVMLKKTCKLTMGQIVLGLEEGDGEAIAAVVYLAKRRAGEVVRWEDMQNMNLIPVMESLFRNVPTQSESSDVDKSEKSSQEAFLDDGKSQKNDISNTSLLSDTSVDFPRQ